MFMFLKEKRREQKIFLNGQPQKYVVEGLIVGTEVEFSIIAVNIVGRKSEPSEPSPAYTVIGKSHL